MKTYKKFDQGLFEVNDLKSKEAATRLLEKLGFRVIDNNESKYEADLFAFKEIPSPEKPRYSHHMVEVERKSQWVDGWPYTNVSSPFRKRELYNSKNSILVIVNRDFTKAVVVDFSLATENFCSFRNGEVFIAVDNNSAGVTFHDIPTNSVKFDDPF